MDTHADKALQYRQRAEHIRVLADRISNSNSRETLLKVAADFDRLADTIEMTVGVFPPEPKPQNSN